MPQVRKIKTNHRGTEKRKKEFETGFQDEQDQKSNLDLSLIEPILLPENVSSSSLVFSSLCLCASVVSLNDLPVATTLSR